MSKISITIDSPHTEEFENLLTAAKGAAAALKNLPFNQMGDPYIEVMLISFAKHPPCYTHVWFRVVMKYGEKKVEMSFTQDPARINIESFVTTWVQQTFLKFVDSCQKNCESQQERLMALSKSLKNSPLLQPAI